MATIYVLVWALLLLEMALCLILIMPLPRTLRGLLLSQLSKPGFLGQFRSTSLIVGVILGAFFFVTLRRRGSSKFEVNSMSDSYFASVDLNESLKWQDKAHHAHEHAAAHTTTHLQEYYQHQSQYFRAQRNYYLSGFAFFLGLVLNRLITVLGDLVKQQQNADVLKKQTMGREAEYDRLRKELEDLKKAKGVPSPAEEAIRKQAENNNQAFLKLVEENKLLQSKLERAQDQLTAKSTTAKKSD